MPVLNKLMNNFPFARRTQWRRETNALNKALEDLQARHIPVMDLTASNPTSCGFLYPEGMLSALNSSENLHYHPDARGMKRARQAVAQYYARCQRSDKTEVGNIIPVSYTHLTLPTKRIV